MEIRITIPNDGKDIEFETISILEDIWHDFQYFKSKSVHLQQQSLTASDKFVVKRYQRAALLMLVFYFEGVLNHWLKQLLSDKEWLKNEYEPLKSKIDTIQKYVGLNYQATINIAEVKKIRNTIAHLKPGGDLDLYDKIDGRLLDSSEKSIVDWLISMEEQHGIRGRHPNTESESKEMRDALGTSQPDSEGYSGIKQE